MARRPGRTHAAPGGSRTAVRASAGAQPDGL